MPRKDEFGHPAALPGHGEIIDYNEHLNEAQISAFLSRSLSNEAYEEIASHLASCTVCRTEAAEINRLVQSYMPGEDSAPRGWRMHHGRVALLAASVAIVALVGGRKLLEDRQARERAEESNFLPTITAIGPTGTISSNIEDLDFRWRSVKTDVYRITVLDETGAKVVSVETADTTATIKAESLPGRGRYFWRVDAIADEVIATSPLYAVELR